MEDYIEEIKQMILQYYSPTGELQQPTQRSTKSVLNEVKGVIPSEPISEHDIFAILKELGFSHSQRISYEKVCTFEGDPENGIPAEYEKQEVSRTFAWNIFPKNTLKTVE